MVQQISFKDWNPIGKSVGKKTHFIRKGITSIIIFMSLLSLAACGTENKTGQSVAGKIVLQEQETQNVSFAVTEEGNAEREENESIANQPEQIFPQIIDYELLGIEEYIYPSEFSMGENLKTAITQLALCYENFDKNAVKSENWKESFIARFIQNSRLSFDYLDMISEKNNGQISVNELNYIQYSLTNTELDFSSYVDGFINRNDSASSLNYGWISEYDYEYTDSGVIITADLETGYDGTDSMQEREITVELIKNPYSCFDGYSVVAVSSKPVTSSNNSNFQNKANNDGQIKKRMSWKI